MTCHHVQLEHIVSDSVVASCLQSPDFEAAVAAVLVGSLALDQAGLAIIRKNPASSDSLRGTALRRASEAELHQQTFFCDCCRGCAGRAAGSGPRRFSLSQETLRAFGFWWAWCIAILRWLSFIQSLCDDPREATKQEEYTLVRHEIRVGSQWPRCTRRGIHGGPVQSSNSFTVPSGTKSTISFSQRIVSASEVSVAPRAWNMFSCTGILCRGGPKRVLEHEAVPNVGANQQSRRQNRGT